MSDVRILLATPHTSFEHQVRSAFDGALNGDLRSWNHEVAGVDVRAGLEELSAYTPHVVAIGPDDSIDTALQLASTLDAERPEITLVLVASPSPGLWEKALRAGIRDVVAPHAAPAELREVFERALQTAERRRASLPTATPAESGTAGRIITVLSPKGGSGKTTVATNLAVGLAACAPEKVAIVDLDLQFGDVGNALRLLPEHTMAHAASQRALDALTVKTYLTPHPTGVFALCAPDAPAEGEVISPDDAGRVIQLLGEEFPYVVVDTASGVSAAALSAVEVSTDLILMCAMDVPSVRNLRKLVEALDTLGMTRQRRHFVLNRADSRVGLAAEDVEATVGMRVDLSLPSSRAVPVSLNQGTPVVESDPRSPIARQLSELAGRFVDEPATRTAASSGFRLRRKG